MIIVHENTQERLDDYLEHRLRNYEIITPIPKKPEIVTQDDHKQKNRKQKRDH